ncbi:MAG: hypothetical protein ACE37B_15190 [Ilumatobacter sp.]|jgi:hypothetical protein|uniref:hypothetical protein n=1 Tax=Ilumatobacter sp. TaxID=1967498 RepID=UPI003919D022
MSHRYQIEIRGRATERLLRPVTDDFVIDTTAAGDTRLTGEIRDPSHLHGLLAHFTSMNAEVVSLSRLDADSVDPHLLSTTEPRQHNQQKGTQP